MSNTSCSTCIQLNSNSYAVKTSQPSSVISSVCSACAEREPSAVTTVHPSSQDTHRVVPPSSTSIGSIVKHIPGFISPVS